MKVSITVNGTATESDVEPRTLLVHYLREHLDLTGTNVGCDTSSCGACTVHLNGEAVKSCTILAVQADGTSVKTIEGMSTNGEMHPMQQAFMENHGLQCGYCTPGMMMTVNAPNRDNALKLMEFLASDEAQRLYADGNFEYPVIPAVAPADIVKSWGSFTPDTLNVAEIAKLEPQASKLIDEVQFND